MPPLDVRVNNNTGKRFWCQAFTKRLWNKKAFTILLMNERKRRENERKFGQWDSLPNGGRRYFYDVLGRRSGWKARYIKEVNEEEETVRFWQEIYDEQGKMVEFHLKFLEDMGHRRLEDRS